MGLSELDTVWYDTHHPTGLLKIRRIPFTHHMMEEIKEKMGQIPPPLEKIENKWRPWLLMSHGKVVRYDIREMSVWKALICSTHTILVEWQTWYLLIFLTVICFTTMAIICLTGQATSIEDTGSVTNRVQYLMTFVIGGYVTLVVNRWNTLRNTTLGILWGSLENLVIYSSYSIRGAEPAVVEIRNNILRYARVVILLTFHGARAEDNIPQFVEKQLLTEAEAKYVQAAMPGTRPLMVIMWIWRSFDRVKSHGVNIPIEGRILIQENVTAARGGVGATLGIIGCPYPFAYIHIIYWVVQIYLFVLAVETGVQLAIYTQRLGNANGEYSTDDNKYHFPENGYIWYFNTLMQITVQNVVFALFTQGLLKICDKMQNPFSIEDSSFPEWAYDAFIHNNCKSMFCGIERYEETQMSKEPEALPPQSHLELDSPSNEMQPQAAVGAENPLHVNNNK